MIWTWMKRKMERKTESSRLGIPTGYIKEFSVDLVCIALAFAFYEDIQNTKCSCIKKSQGSNLCMRFVYVPFQQCDYDFILQSKG